MQDNDSRGGGGGLDVSDSGGRGALHFEHICEVQTSQDPKPRAIQVGFRAIDVD